jgi:hypothetical protein
MDTASRTGDDDSSTGPFGDGLRAVRADPTRRRVAMLAGAVAGLLLATVHWAGLFVGGALVGLPARGLRRAVPAGVAFGVLAYLAFLATLALGGVLDAYLGTGRLLAVTVVAPPVAGGLGALVRGVV